MRLSHFFHKICSCGQSRTKDAAHPGVHGDGSHAMRPSQSCSQLSQQNGVPLNGAERQHVIVAAGSRHLQLRSVLACAARTGVLLACGFLGAIVSPLVGRCQELAAPSHDAPAASASADRQEALSSHPTNDPLPTWEGLPVRRISIEGVPDDRLGELARHLPQTEGAPLTAENLRRSERRGLCRRPL